MNTAQYGVGVDSIRTNAEPEEAAAAGKGEDKRKAKKQKQKGCYAPQRLLTAVCKVAPHFKVKAQSSSAARQMLQHDRLQGPISIIASLQIPAGRLS